jgi:hypothetical protein
MKKIAEQKKNRKPNWASPGQQAAAVGSRKIC